MADGATHERAILIASGITLISSVLLLEEIKPSILIASNLGLISNIFISNDHDQDGSTLPELRTAQLFTFFIPKKLGRFYLQDKILRLIKIFFSPYAMWFKHRSVWTHFPPFCTLIRCGYIYTMHWWLFHRNSSFLELNYFILNNYFYEMLFFLFFVCVGDIIHTTLDKWELVW